jgi:hypothetical protein
LLEGGGIRFSERRPVRLKGVDKPVRTSEVTHSYSALANRVARSAADGVFLAGYLFFNGGEVIKALRARLGRDFVIMAGDAFIPVGVLLKAAGPTRWECT